jgi:hypothetical protein
LHGTEGTVVYQIQDGMVNFQAGAPGAPKLITGQQNEITIHWSNPVIGPPKAPDVSFQSAGDIYVVPVVSSTSGGTDQLPDFGTSIIIPAPIVFVFDGEVDNPFVVMALQLVPGIKIMSFSVRRAFSGVDLSQGIRRLKPGGGAFGLRNLMDI